MNYENLDTQQKFVLEQLRTISGESTVRVDNVLKALFYYILMSYSENECIKIPYLGLLKVEYDKDISTKEGKVADIKLQFSPSSDLILNLGLYKDFEKNGKPLSELPFVKQIISELKNQLKEKVKEQEELINV